MWATNLNETKTKWIFDLFKQNMREMYLKSQDGYNEHLKQQELFATTSRYLIINNLLEKPIAFIHYRFVLENNYPVLYW